MISSQDSRFKKILSLLPKTERIRNVSIVAHVDHGKTTIADCLISSNGIIHKKQAGQLRLLDDRLDEQDRGITMKSSSISLTYQDHLINLIDSPGHLEFYSEVSSALRLTDSALLVVDAVEGVSSQTYRVLKELYDEKLPSLLVLNKIDKLVSHCQMEPIEAYNHLNQIIEQVNAVLGSFISAELNINRNNRTRTKSEDLQNTEQFEDLESKFYFSTEKKNIVFASAIDNWGWTSESFSDLIAKKLQKEPQNVEKFLWGDYFFNPKTKEFSTEPRKQNENPFCVDFILKPIWDIFDNVINQNKDKIEKVITMLNLKIQESTKKTYNNQLIREILNAWLPLDAVLLKKISQILPNPIKAQNFRLPYLLNQELYEKKDDYESIKKALSICSHENQLPVIAFVSKMVNIPRNNFNERGLATETNSVANNESTRTLGFARIFSGKLKRGDQILVIGAKKKKVVNPKTEQIEQVPDIEKVIINDLYIFNGQYPDGVTEAYAGNIVGLGNLEESIFKSGTLSSTPNCVSFIPVNGQGISILKVSISTPNIEDNQRLLEGLKKLNKSDPSVEIYIESTGDIILNCCGEVHLEKCIVDLENIYCRIPIVTSDPIISFRETIIWTKLDENKNQKYIMEAEKKKRQKEKRLLLEKFKEERISDAELDEQEKEKLKAIKEWDANVEIYDSEDLTVNDIRFFFKEREDEEEEKYSYKEEKELKKTDHKNRGKLHTKQKFVNLNMKTNVNKQLTPNQLIWIKVRALGMNFEVAEFLEREVDRMKKYFGSQQIEAGHYTQKFNSQRQQFLKHFLEKLKEFEVQQNVIQLLMQKLVCFGPNGWGSNLLVFRHMKPSCSLFDKCQTTSKFNLETLSGPCLEINEEIEKLIFEDYKLSLGELENSIKLGFDIACRSGPLCNEPMAGVIFIVEDIFVNKNSQIIKQGIEANLQQQESLKIETKELEKVDEKRQSAKTEQIPEQQVLQKPKEEKQNKNFTDSFGPLAGQIMSTVKDACIEAFVGGSPRLVEPMYLVELQTDQQYYGNVYNQLSKRRAMIISEDLHEISNVFIIKAYLSVTESKRFCFKLLDNSKGTINAQLRLDTWKIYNEDPFFIPLSEEEIQENGLDNVTYNHARVLLEKIRAKKGIATTSKIVVASEKQRTLKKN